MLPSILKQVEAQGYTKEQTAASFYKNPKTDRCLMNAWAFKYFNPQVKIKVCFMGFGCNYAPNKGVEYWIFDGEEDSIKLVNPKNEMEILEMPRLV